MIWDFFFRTENKNFHEYWKNRPAHQHRMNLPVDFTLEQAIAAARKDGVSKGSSRSGIFEVQNDLGIYSDCLRKTKMNFKTWEELETLERN